MSIYYAVVEGDPLTSGGNSRIIEGNPHCTIQGPDGQHRKQAYLGHEAWCADCQSVGIIVAGARISESLRGRDFTIGGAQEAVDGDIVICKCETPPRVIACYARSVTYIDEDRAAPIVAGPAAQSGRTYDEQVTASVRGVSVQGYPYLIETSDGQIVCGRADGNGRLPRIYTDSAGTYAIHWGDEALSHEGWPNAE
ncbi:PAAR domain-containing protein [Paraburkholderia sacchari]|uniref:PAAR domain-containing protein n=1 Tax=Paraburkholderia sacchari TaxID=159450 RepID=UPI0039A706F1